MQKWIFLCEVNNEFSNHFLFMIDYRKINYGRHEPVVKLKKKDCKQVQTQLVCFDDLADHTLLSSLLLDCAK